MDAPVPGISFLFDQQRVLGVGNVTYFASCCLSISKHSDESYATTDQVKQPVRERRNGLSPSGCN
jgi:hypothetical protein